MTAPELWAIAVADHIGITPPSTDYAHWLDVHQDMAAACMSSVEYGLLSQEMGWDT